MEVLILRGVGLNGSLKTFCTRSQPLKECGSSEKR